MSDNEHDDETLAPASTGAAFGVVDTTPEQTPEDFSWDDFLAGMRPTHRSVKVYARADLVGVMEEMEGPLLHLEAEYEDAVADGAPASRKREIKARFDDALAEFEKVRAAFFASGKWFTVGKRSSEWIEKFRTEAAERHSIVLPAKDAKGEDAELPVEHHITLLLDQLAEQIVTPTGVTADGLRRLLDVNEGELNKLIVAMTAANSQMAQSAGVLTRDFSLSRSVKTPQGGSVKPSGRR